MSGDDETGYVYLPTGAPTNDSYGGHRLGDNLFSNSLVCLDAETGKRVWHRQIIHHGLWDHDLPAAPTLIDITVDGKPIKAVAQVTKHGFVFVLDRDAERILIASIDKLRLTARSYHKVLRLARSIADMANEVEILPPHLAEAIAYRQQDRGWSQA